MITTLEQVIKPKGSTPGLWLIKNDKNDEIIGQLEKYADSEHPWKLYEGTGENRKFVKSFYRVDGGCKAAIDYLVSIKENG